MYRSVLRPAPGRRFLAVVLALVMLLGGLGEALQPRTAEAAETPSLPLRQGDTGTDVVSLQLLLASAGYNPGPADGVFGSMTRAAVQSFQTFKGLTADGVVGAATWAALNEDPPPVVARRGDRGDQVRSIQQMLATAGFDPGPIDGIFGSRTEGSVELYQKAKGLPQTGVVDQATWDALTSGNPDVIAERGDRGETARQVQLLLATAGFNPGPIDGIFGGQTEAAVIAFQQSADLGATGIVDQSTWNALSTLPDTPETVLEQGDRGPQVEGLQDELATVGFDPGPIDGIFGSKTTLAVRRFQSVHGLPGDGVVTPETLEKLEELVPLARSAFDYGYDPSKGARQWKGLVTEVFAKIGLDAEACGPKGCLGPQIDNAIVIMKCESAGVPMAVNYDSGTTGLFQHRPVFWADRLSRARDLFPTLPADASPYNPEHNVMVAAMLIHESREALIGNNTLTGPWDDGPQPFGHWDSSSRYCASPPLVDP